MKKLNEILNVLDPADRRQFRGHVAGMFLLSVLELISLGGLLYFLHRLFGPSATPGVFFGSVFQEQGIIFWGMFFVVLFIGKNAVSWYFYKGYTSFVYKVASQLSSRMLRRFQDLSFTNYTAQGEAETIRNVSHVPVEYSQYVLFGAMQIISEGILLLCVTVGVLVYDPYIFAGVLVIVGPGFLLANRYNRKAIRSIRGQVKAQSSIALQYLMEATAAYTEGRVYGKKSFFRQRYAQRQGQLNTALGSLLSLQQVPRLLLEVFAVMVMLAIMMAMSAGSASATGILLTCSVFLAGAYKAIPSMNRIMVCAANIKIYQYTMETIGVYVPDDDNNEAKGNIDFNSEVQLESISYRYAGDGGPLFSKIDLQMAKGAVTVISGPSGTGKSTLVNLLLGMLTPDEGTVRIDGTVLAASTVAAWQKNVAYVKQRPFILHASVAVNIALEDNPPIDERMREVIRAVKLDDFIGSLPGGLNSIIQDDGRNISGGELRRIGIARALYQDRPLLVLDESLNELDEQTIEQVCDELLALSRKGKTVLIVSHLPQVARYAHKRYVLENGRLVIQ